MLNYETLPNSDLEGAFQRWVDHAIPPGSFVEALLQNDLLRAVGTADSWNRRLLPELIQWMVCELPVPCWGSKENYTNWRGLKER